MTELERKNQIRRQKRDYMRAYRLTHPEYRERECIRRSVSMLTKRGYTVIEPDTGSGVSEA